MRIVNMQKAALSLSILLGLGAGVLSAPNAAYAQSLTAGDLAGTVTDASGAAIAGATLKLVSKETGTNVTGTSNATGAYRFSLLKPGNYTLTVSANGFSDATTQAIVSVDKVTQQNVLLSVGSASSTVEVTSDAQVLQTDNADLTTTFSYQQIQSVPNPGGDITYIAQTAPGAVMNTAGGGYGNFAVFGLPATSNNYTMNGMEINDPFLNLNNSGPSNLLLGVNDVAEMNVATNAYGAQNGSFGGAQVNAISRSGTNALHGNASWYWNGSSLNANDWFNDYYGTAKPFSNANQWMVGVGGPIWKNKTFFFVDYEGLDFITAGQNQVFLPNASYTSSVLGTNGACSDATSSLFNAGKGAECAYYQNLFSLWAGTPNAGSAQSYDGSSNELAAPANTHLKEQLLTVRIDQNIGNNDKIFGHFKYDVGTQPTYTDPINSAFNSSSHQPDYEGQFNETHVFSPNLVNSFLATGAWYGAIFQMTNATQAAATLPYTLYFTDGEFSNLNNEGYFFPQGRNATQVQIADDLSWTKGKQTLRFGFSWKKDYVSDNDPSELTTPLVFTSAADFAQGQTSAAFGYTGEQAFPTKLEAPLSLYSLGFYAQDDYKFSGKLTLNAGIRVERNSNVSCADNCLSNFGGDFFSQAANTGLGSASAAYNSQILYNQRNAFNNYQRYEVEPRVGFAYSINPKTVLRGGFGIFTDVFPGTIADSELNNIPFSGVYQPTTVGSIVPTDADSVQSQAAAANTAFTTGFAGGGSFATISAANPIFVQPNFTSVAAHLHYPTYNEWNLQIQRELSAHDSIQIGYVGNNGYHEPVQNNGANAYAPAGNGLPTAAPAPSFGIVTEVDSSASSNYNGVIVSYLRHSKSLNLQVNYTYSHALDEVSNGGLLPFGNSSIYNQINPYSLKQNYGNADEDVRHYLSANYDYTLPYYGGPHVLTEGWELSGTVFARSGLPFTPSANVGDWGVSNYGGQLTQVAPIAGTNYTCGKDAAVNPCLSGDQFNSLNTTGTGVLFGAYDRNQYFGPKFFDADMTVAKNFKIWRTAALNLAVTAYNVFNHPNFANPDSNVDTSQFGLITATVGPPTSIYGAGYGDASVRILQFRSKITF